MLKIMVFIVRPRVNCFAQQARFSTVSFHREYGQKTAFLSIWSDDVENKPVDKAVPQTEACLDTRTSFPLNLNSPISVSRTFDSIKRYIGLGRSTKSA